MTLLRSQDGSLVDVFKTNPLPCSDLRRKCFWVLVTFKSSATTGCNVTTPGLTTAPCFVTGTFWIRWSPRTRFGLHRPRFLCASIAAFIVVAVEMNLGDATVIARAEVRGTSCVSRSYIASESAIRQRIGVSCAFDEVGTRAHYA